MKKYKLHISDRTTGKELKSYIIVGPKDMLTLVKMKIKDVAKLNPDVDFYSQYNNKTQYISYSGIA